MTEIEVEILNVLEEGETEEGQSLEVWVKKKDMTDELHSRIIKGRYADPSKFVKAKLVIEP